MESRFTVITRKISGPETDRILFHDRVELMLVRVGQGSLFLDGELLPLGRGSFALIPPGALHFAVPLPKEELELALVRFDPSAAEAYSSEQTPLSAVFTGKGRMLTLSEDETERTETLLSRLEAAEEGFGGDLRRELAFPELLLAAGELFRRNLPAEAPCSRDRKRLEPLIRRIREHPELASGLEKVAEEFHYNKNYLCRVFKNAAGTSVGGYITAARITAAAGCLSRGMNVRESGEAAGFRNNSNFISVFHRMTGLSPGQYRLRFRKEHPEEV